MLRSVITDCYILYNHIMVVFLDTFNAHMEGYISISLFPFHCWVIIPNLQGFHMESKIRRWQVYFSDNFSLQPWHFFTPKPENRTTSVKFQCVALGGEYQLDISSPIIHAASCSCLPKPT